MAELTGQEIYDNFQKGAGPDGLVQGADQVNAVIPVYIERALQIQRLVAEMEPLWQGDAAEGAKHGAAPMLSAHSEIVEKFLTAQDLVNRQAESFGDAKNRVVPVPPAPTEVTPWILASPGELGTYHKQLGEHNSAAQQNVDVMNGYTGASTYNTDNIPAGFDTLASDNSGLSVAEPDTIDSDSFGGSGGDGNGPRGSVPPPGPGPGPGGDISVGPGGSGSATPSPDTRLPSEGDTPGTTTPGAYTPGPGGPTGAPLPAADLGRPGPASGPGVGVGFPIGGGGESGGRGPAGGAGGGAPRGGPVGGPVPRGGAGAGAEPHGQGPRAAPTGGPTAAGRGPGMGMGGVPMGAGRGRGDEDTERKTPEYLDGGDPYELYDTDLVVAPPTIGDEDDD